MREVYKELVDDTWKTHEVEFEITNVEKTTTKDQVEVALQNVVDKEVTSWV